MSNTSLGFSFIESTDKIKGKLKPKKKEVKMPQPAIEERPEQRLPIEPQHSPEIQTYEESYLNNEDEDEELANVDFSPPPKPQSSGVERTKAKEKALIREEQHPAEPFSQLTDEFAKEYLPFSTPQLNTGQHENTTSSDLEKKLNYMIHLLEDQKDEKTGGITEEIVLYCFLGVFIIFVLDSFAKVGKYVR
jgi:hypothetical protein